MADYDHHGNEIPAQKHSRADIHGMMRGQVAPATDQRRVHPREYAPAWSTPGWEFMSEEERMGFDLERIHKNLHPRDSR